LNSELKLFLFDLNNVATPVVRPTWMAINGQKIECFLPELAVLQRSNQKFCECMRIAEHSSRFSLRVMEAMRWLQRQEDDLLPTSSVEDIVGYIQVNYRDDGDLYAQVRTALKQVCSQGFVMELLENEYHLIGPNAISMNQVTCLNDRKDCSLPALIKKRKRDDEDNNCNCETTSDEEPELPSKNRRVSANESRTTSRKQERRGRDISTGETQECSCSTTSTDENVNQCVCENEMHKSAKDNSRKQRTIKKGSINRDGQQINTKSKSKNSSVLKDLEDYEKVDLKLTKTREKRKEVDNHTRLTQNVQSSKSSVKHSIRSPKSISVKETLSSTSKSNVNNSKMLSKSILNSKTSIDPTKKSSTNAIKGSKSSSGRIQSNYSEKRGLSTIYIPQSLTSKLNAKLNKSANYASKRKEQDKIHSNTLVETTSKFRQCRLSRTLSPSEVKMLHFTTNIPNSSEDLDQNNKKQAEALQADNEDDYEDDFEEYESDFQECTDSETSEVSEETSSNHTILPLDPIELQTTKQRKTVDSSEQKEEEHMHDSGHYELTEARKRAARIESIANDPKLSALLEIKQPINKSYSEDRLENKSLPLSTDEGFEDSRSGDFTKSPPLSQISFIDFRKNKEEQKTKKCRKILNRGEELLEMIKLDVMEWSLLECSPIPYEEFIRNYGKSNAQQICTQTGEDNIDIETQTEKIIFKNKWTQFPITCRKNLQTKKDLDLFRMDQIGVGSDNDVEIINYSLSQSFDVLRLSDFMNRAGKVMLSLLEERRSGGNLFKNEEEIPFSDGVVKLSINSVTFLAGRAVTIIHYSEVINQILLTIHSSVEEEIETSSKQDYITDCYIGCIWNISQPSMPIKLLYSTCPITACCFHSSNYNIVFAGLEDGSISLWDLKEDEMWHQKVTDKANDLDWTIRMPTYTTATNEEVNASATRIICSLNENGSIVIWSALHNMGKNIDDLGLSYWGSIKLVKSQELFLQSNHKKKRISAATFIDMHVDCINSNNLYIVTNSSSVLHGTCIGNKANPALYTKLDTSVCGNVTSIEICPFEQSFFLVKNAAIEAYSDLINGRSAVDAIEKAISYMESKPFFNCAKGGCLDVNDEVVTDAAIMTPHGAGCIGAVRDIEHPISLEGEYSYCALSSDSPDWDEPIILQAGAVGVVAYDRKKRIASGTSTAGEPGKPVGFVSAIGTVIGCGIYTDEHGCTSVSGNDTSIYCYAPARKIIRKLSEDISISTAVNTMLQDFEKETGDSHIGAITLNAKGEPYISFRCTHFPWAFCSKGYVYYGMSRNEKYWEKITILERPLDCMCISSDED
ncbi:WD repeat-containing protein 60, partial [Eufriesea mexicana]